MSLRILTIPLAVLPAASLIAAPVPIINGDFNNGGDAWAEINGDGSFTYEYPTTGGNPANHGIIDNTGGGGWGIWVANYEFEILLVDLGLTAGETYTFSQDMKILSGNNIGGFKVDFFQGGALNGSTGDIFPTLIGDGSTWETYDFEIAIPSGTEGIKVVPLWGADSRVGYDNVLVDDSPIQGPSGIIDGDFELADGVNWEQTSGSGDFVYNFPATGGNPGGLGIIDNTGGGGWGVMVTNNGAILPLANIGLEAGEAYVFKQDMKILAGTNLGGFKVDFFNGGNLSGSTGDIRPELIGDGSSWETYEFQISIPSEATGIKVVPLWGQDSSVGFDNVRFETIAIEVPEIAEIPNGSFEEGGNKWQDFGAPNTAFTYETSGGNPDGHAVMTNDGAGYGVIVANSGGILPIEGLGLSVGRTYTFSQDMRLLSGTEMGGMKVEFYNSGAAAGDTGDLRAPIIGDGSTWQSYDYDVTIPFGVNGIKVVPLWGPGSSVAIDNVRFSTVSKPSPAVLNFDFENGGANWENFSDNGLTTFTFPETGGNPGGYAELANTASWGVLVANNASITPIANFGITEEGDYEFKMDMKIFSGDNIGGLKIEYFVDGLDAGTTGDLFPELIGDGSTWETYTFNIFVPEGTTGLKVVPLWGPESTIGIDNVVTPQGGATGYAGWIEGFPGVGAETGFNDDPDNDGSPNGLENFFGTDPSVSSAGLVAGITIDSAFSSFFFTHPQNDSPAEDLSAPVYQWSTDLENYYGSGETSPGGVTIAFDTESNTPAAGTTTVEASVTGSLQEKIFVRVVVSQ
ncbi:MAG: hypothetical protein ACON5H_09650 [Akkermansiaceae bacterium]